MRSLKSWAAAAAILGGALTLSGAASAAPVTTAGGLASGTPSALAETVQYWGPGYGYRGPRRYHRYRHYHRPYYRPRVVCRVRYTPWGPREVCRRRW